MCTEPRSCSTSFALYGRVKPAQRGLDRQSISRLECLSIPLPLPFPLVAMSSPLPSNLTPIPRRHPYPFSAPSRKISFGGINSRGPLGRGETPQGKLFDQVVQSLAIRRGQGIESNSHARLAGFAIANLTLGLEDVMADGNPHAYGCAHLQAAPAHEQAADAQIVCGIFYLDFLFANLEFNGLVEQHAGERP